MTKSNIEEIIGLLQAILGMLLLQAGFTAVAIVFFVLGAFSAGGSIYYTVKAVRNRT